MPSDAQLLHGPFHPFMLSIERERGASERERAVRYSYKDARDLVVLAVGNAYLVALSDAARVETAQAQVETAQALYDKTSDEQKAGVVPAIDALRAQVELQARQQELIAARNDFAKQKLALARAIGLPSGGAIRASLGTATNTLDIERFAAFAGGFVDLADVPDDLPPRTGC